MFVFVQRKAWISREQIHWVLNEYWEYRKSLNFDRGQKVLQEQIHMLVLLLLSFLDIQFWPVSVRGYWIYMNISTTRAITIFWIQTSWVFIRYFKNWARSRIMKFNSSQAMNSQKLTYQCQSFRKAIKLNMVEFNEFPSKITFEMLASLSAV